MPQLQKSSQFSHQNLSHPGKENTSVPDSRTKASPQPAKSALSQESTVPEDCQLFLDALYLSRRFGKEYMDDASLVGEPGAFRVSKVRDSTAPGETTSSDRQVYIPAKDKGPSAKIPLPIQTDVPKVDSKKSVKGGDGGPNTPGGREKPKRRKSRPVITPTEA